MRHHTVEIDANGVAWSVEWDGKIATNRIMLGQARSPHTAISPPIEERYGKAYWGIWHTVDNALSMADAAEASDSRIRLESAARAATFLSSAHEQFERFIRFMDCAEHEAYCRTLSRRILWATTRLCAAWSNAPVADGKAGT